MPNRAFQIPLPGRIPCDQCATALMDRLAHQAGVMDVSISDQQVEIDVDDQGFDYATILTVVGDVGAGHLHRREHVAQAPRGRHAHEYHARIDADARTNRRRLLIVLLGGAVLTTIEVLGALASHSLVLLADAAHYGTDLLAVLVAFLAVSVGMRPASRRQTFGFQRVEVIAAFLQALSLWGVSAFFVYEAVRRTLRPTTVDGSILLAVGALSLLGNGLLAWILRRPSGANVNVRAAYIHVLSDALGSAAAILAGALVSAFGWHLADPILTFFVTILILVFTWRLTGQTFHILMEGTPTRIDPQAVEDSLRRIDGVREVHDLHLWTLTSGVDSLSTHLVLDTMPQDDRVTHEAHARIREQFNIHHTTVQVESPACPCDTMRHQWRAAG